MDAFKTYFALDSAYTLNSFMYHLRRFPVIKHLFRSNSYEAGDFKFIWIFLSATWRLGSTLIWALVYYLIASLICTARMDGFEGTAPLLVHFYMCLVLIGGLTKNELISTDYTHYYAINLLRVDAKKYILTQYCMTLLKGTSCGLIYMALLWLIYHFPPVFILLYPVFMVAVKVIFCAIRILGFERTKKDHMMPMHPVPSILLIIIFALAGFACFVTLYFLPYNVLWLIIFGTVLISVPCFIKLVTYKDYLIYFKRAVMQSTEVTVEKQKSLKVAHSNEIDSKTALKSSNRSGFAFLNELFDMRHHKLLSSATKLITFFILGIGLLAVVSIVFLMPASSVSDLFGNVSALLPALPFVFYLINRGQGYSAALFSNCDRAMLHYTFFRKRENLLRLFQFRLFSIAKQNLPPALAMSVSLTAVRYLSAEYGENIPRADIFELLLFMIAPLALSVFFSVHYLMLYYLFQPFDVESKSKSIPYNIAMGFTYFVCYMCFSVLRDVEIKPAIFGSALVVFCIVYSALACLLVYMLAPKTFKNRT